MLGRVQTCTRSAFALNRSARQTLVGRERNNRAQRLHLRHGRACPRIPPAAEGKQWVTKHMRTPSIPGPDIFWQ